MDKMIQTGKGATIITNDGNTMLKDMSVMHPAAKMLVDLSAAQDVEAGDGTTSVVVIAGSLLGAAERLLGKGQLSEDRIIKARAESMKVYILQSYQSLSSERQGQQCNHYMTCRTLFRFQIEPHYCKLLRRPFHQRSFHSTPAC